MRHIHIADGMGPKEEWQKKAAKLLEDLDAAPDREAREKIIDANAAVWGELKEWLLGFSHSKCWFSEARDCFSHLDVEHYRPKKVARDEDGTAHEGYWWLTFDWRNFRVCGNAGNRKKGGYFPLRAMCPRVGRLGDIRQEDPQLLDPTEPGDPDLLSFNIEGKAIVAAHLSDPWERQRSDYSIVRYNLNFPQLASKRKAIWADCWARIQEFLLELQKYHADKTNGIARDRYKQAIRRVLFLMRQDQELSAVARACVLSTGDPRVVSLVRGM